MTTKRLAVWLKKSKKDKRYRHVNGRYYARLTVVGKPKERSLRTSLDLSEPNVPREGGTRTSFEGPVGTRIQDLLPTGSPLVVLALPANVANSTFSDTHLLIRQPAAAERKITIRVRIGLSLLRISVSMDEDGGSTAC